ncbi:MAG: transketolase-like TK C-terminal-containing protein, partial [Gammaproteobacteria bacterium]
VMNENYPQPSKPEGVEDGIVRGMYRYTSADAGSAQIRLLGSGTILREVLAAAGLLKNDWRVTCEVWSVTSFTELARDARATARWNRLHADAPPKQSYLVECLAGEAPIVAATDYVAAYPQLIAPYLAAPLHALGTDGFGRSDTRSALRDFFETDRKHIVITALAALRNCGDVSSDTFRTALETYSIDTERRAPWLS